MPDKGSRTYWFAPDLTIKNEPLIKSLIEYRQNKNRFVCVDASPPGATEPEWVPPPNLVSSLTSDGTQMPILDMDFPHHYEKSTTDGHSHLYIDLSRKGRIRARIAVWLLNEIWNRVLRRGLL